MGGRIDGPAAAKPTLKERAGNLMQRYMERRPNKLERALGHPAFAGPASFLALNTPVTAPLAAPILLNHAKVLKHHVREGTAPYGFPNPRKSNIGR